MENSRHRGKAWKFSQELKDVTGGDKGKAWDVLKANLEGSIEKQERLLASGGIRDGDARIATEREVAQLQKALDGLKAEGRP